MPKTRTATMRLPMDQAEQLEFVARVDGLSVSAAVREAVAAHIAARRADPEFQARLRERMEADKAVLKRLAKS